MSSNLHELQNHDSSFYGDAIEEQCTEKRFLNKRSSSLAECAKTEQGDHQSSNANDILVKKSFDESKLLSSNSRSYSSSTIPGIDSTVEDGEGELTIVASITSRIEEFNDNSEASSNPPASAAAKAQSNESLVMKSEQRETLPQNQTIPSSQSISLIPTVSGFQTRRTSQGKIVSSRSISKSLPRHRCSTSKRFPSPLSSGSDNCLRCSSRLRNGDETELGVTELAEALHQLSRDARFRSIRPLWRNPNSRLLPSDETASVEAMLREYNNLLLTATSNANVSSSPVSQLAVRRPYHSTLNRWRQQERIQIENFILANRLRNIRPSPETSREVLLKHYKEYFITPITAQSLTKMSTLDPDTSLPRCRFRCSSARSAQLGTPRPLKPLPSNVIARAAPASPRASVCGCPSISRGSVMETPRSREVIDSLNSVRRALHEQRVKGKL